MTFNITSTHFSASPKFVGLGILVCAALLLFCPESFGANEGLAILKAELLEGANFFTGSVMKTGLLGASIVGFIASVWTGNFSRAIIIVLLGIVLVSYTGWIAGLGVASSTSSRSKPGRPS